MKLVFTKVVNKVPLEQCHHKPIGMYSGGILSFPPGDNCDSSLPLEQCVNTPQKNPWPNFGGLNNVQFSLQVKG